jgi:hypothetical protein
MVPNPSPRKEATNTPPRIGPMIALIGKMQPDRLVASLTEVIDHDGGGRGCEPGPANGLHRSQRHQ